MKRLLFSCSVLLMAGLYAGYFLSADISFMVISAAIIAGIIKTLKSRDLYLKSAAIFLSCSLIIGLLMTPLTDNSHKTDFSVGEKVAMTLRVCETPEINKDYCSYVCDISFVNGNSTKGKIKLSYSNGENILAFGDIFTAECKITEPDEPLNRDGFDYGLYLKTKGIFHTGYITNDNIKIISHKNYTLMDRFKLLNISLCKNIDKSFNEEDAILLKAILLGEKTDMPSSYYSDLKRSGLSHIAAVSGLHLSCIIMMLVSLRKLFAIRKRIFAVFVMGFSLCFMMLTGMSPSIIRATIMICCIFSGDLFLRRSDSLTSLGIAALIIVFQNPYQAFNTSFILSFSATAGIVVFAERLDSLVIPDKLRNSKNLFTKILVATVSIICVSLSAQLFSMPFSIFIFREFSLWAIPANILISPLLPIILGGGFLFCILSLIYMPAAILFAKALSVVVAVARWIVSFFSNLDFGILRFGEITPLFIFSYILIVVGIVLFLYKKRAQLIYPTAILFVAVCFALTQNITQSDTSFVKFINVGQGDCTLITLPDDINILIDGGEYSEASEENPSSTTVCSYLIKNGVKNIDIMLATHANSDHIGGLLPVMDYFDVGMLVLPPKFIDGELSQTLIDKAKAKNVPIYSMMTGDNFTFSEDIKLTALMPDEYTAENEEAGNNTSLAVRLDCYSTSFLFMGDIESETELYMLRLLKEKILDIDVLKVGHHGSDTSSTEAFLEKTSPRFAVIPVGKNSFGHPSSEVLERLSSMDIAVFRTDINKDIIFILTKDGISNIIYS